LNQPLSRTRLISIHFSLWKKAWRPFKLRNEALYKDPLAKEDCPICFLRMPVKLKCCMSLPPAPIWPRQGPTVIKQWN
jgi:hypothetical protein